MRKATALQVEEANVLERRVKARTAAARNRRRAGIVLVAAGGLEQEETAVAASPCYPPLKCAPLEEAGQPRKLLGRLSCLTMAPAGSGGGGLQQRFEWRRFIG